MAEKKKALGKGLSTTKKTLVQILQAIKILIILVKRLVLSSELPLDQIEVNPFQPRTDFDNEALQELAISIQQLGIIQPLTVRNWATTNTNLFLVKDDLGHLK